jgi:proliferating cell nuclear antigen
MKLVVAEAPAFKVAIDAIVNLVEDGVFEVKKDGLYLRAMDPSQISMITFSMPKSAFAEYNVSEEQKVGLSITQLASILSRAKHGEKAELSLEDGRLIIKFLAEKKKRTFKIPLLQTGEALQREPKIDTTNYVKIDGDAFKEALKDAKLISSHVRLVLTENTFSVEVRGESGDAHTEFEKGGKELIEVHVVGSGARATFPLQYLEDIVKASTAGNPVTIYLATDKPLKLEYELSGAKATYYLAPRIESE